MKRLEGERKEFADAHVEKYVGWVMSHFLNPELYRKAVRRLGSKEDVYQTLAYSFCYLIAGFREFRWEGGIPGMVARQVVASLIQTIERKRNQYCDMIGDFDIFDAETSTFDPDNLEFCDEVEKSFRFLEGTSEPLRTIVRRCLVDGETLQVVGWTYGLSKNAISEKIKGWLARARRALKEK